jgi:anti-sigma regulatory factor (Ser/Thr protein kinase)
VSNGPGAPAEARRFVRSLGDRLPDSLLDDAALVVSELVTNSYKHAGAPEGSPINLILNLDEERLRVAVIDHSIFDPTPEGSKELRETKWGLFLVDRIADNWGRISEGGIWAELLSPPKNP